MRTFALETTGLLLAALLAATGCEGAAAESERTPEEEAIQDFSNIPVPPADGPRLFVTEPGVRVAEKPEAGASILGELRVGGSVARSEEPYSRSDCEGGWYAIRPRGFVCLGEGTSLEGGPTNIPPPNLDRALPYRYGILRAPSPVYRRVPSGEEQLAAEPKVSKFLDKLPKAEEEDWGNAANDVPLDDRGVANGPPTLLPESEGANAEGRRTTASWFSFGEPITPSFVADAMSGDAKQATLRKKSGLAVAATVMAGEGPRGPRAMGVTPSGQLVPMDRMRPALGTAWHGIDLTEVGLPVVFVQKYGVVTYRIEDGKAIANEDELLRRTAVPITNKFRTINGVRYEEAREGFWLRTRDLIVVIKRTKLPDFASGEQKWVDVSLANHTMTLYEGRKPIYATFISPGRDVLGDPETSAATPRGVFHVTGKYITRDLDPREVERAYDVKDAPWVLEFAPGAAFVGNYWFDNIGRPTMFHSIGLSPIDARRLWMWAEPEVPEGWLGVNLSEEEGTIINVRK